MSPFFKVLRSDPEADYDVVSSEELLEGEQIVSYQGLSVPVTIEGNLLIAQVNRAMGDLDRIELVAFGTSKLSEQGAVRDIIFECEGGNKDKECTLMFMGRENDDPDLCVEFHQVQPHNRSKER